MWDSEGNMIGKEDLGTPEDKLKYENNILLVHFFSSVN